MWNLRNFEQIFLKFHSSVHRPITLHVAVVPKHMKRFEILLKFDSTEISCLLINVLYIEII